MVDEASLATGQNPLDGVRVLDITRFLAGPYAAWVLAELGADVIKVEDPDRPDEARSVGPYFTNQQSLYFAALNSGKRSLAVRMRAREGRQLLLELVRNVDVVLDNHKPGVMERLGLAPAALTRENPHVVTCSLSGFGANGPLRERAGYDYTIQALSGVMSMTGEPDSPPGKAGISYVDHSGGLAAALAVCAALIGRYRRNQGSHIDLGLFDVQISMLTYLASWQLNADFEGHRTASASHPSLVPAQNFETTNGHISIFVGNDAMWSRLASALGHPYLSSERFLTSSGRQEHREELVGRIASIIRSRSTEHWVGLLERHHVPCAPVNDLDQALRVPQISERDLVASATHPSYGRYRYVRGPLPQLGRSNGSPAPLLGEHTVSILEQCGIMGSRVRSLLDKGIIMAMETGNA